MEDYKKMLEAVRMNLPEAVFLKERFEIPKALGHIQGNRTIISNFLQIASNLRREVNHLLKYVLKELATPGEIKKSGALILGTKVPASRINEKIRQYAHEFVLCLECGKPDTKIEKEGELTYMKCTACGVKNFVKAKI
ncbi:MAG: translation initiation factor IF-2 subunit beta [Nanoarchaeota archaeon]